MMKPLRSFLLRRILSVLGVAASLIFILSGPGVAAVISVPERVTLDAYEGYTQPIYTGIALQMDVPLETISLQWQNQWMSVSVDADWQALNPNMPLLVTVFPGMSEGIHTDTIRLTAQDGTTADIPVVFTVRPNRIITPSQITFGEVSGYMGEVSTAVQISMDGTANKLLATSSNPDITASLSSSSMNSGDHTLLTVRARNGLDAGEHTALITLTSDNSTGAIPVTFSVSIAKSLHAPQGVSFSAIHGYSNSPQTTAEVGVSGAATNLHVESDNRNIAVSISPTSINGGEKAIMTFRAANGLAVGKHTAYVVLSADGFLPETFPVTFTVSQSNSLSASSEIAFSLREGYEGQPSTTLQVGVIGTASNIRASSSNPAIEAFIQPETLTGEKNATLTLRAQPSLSPNRYVSVITLTANECSTNISVVLNVEANDSAPAASVISENDLPADTPEATLPEATIPDATLPDATLPEATLPDASAAQSANITLSSPITVNASETASVEAQSTPAPQSKTGSIFNCEEWVYIRSGPGTEYPAIDHASLGESLELLEWSTALDWCRVRLVDQGGEGWVHAKFVRKY